MVRSFFINKSFYNKENIPIPFKINYFPLQYYLLLVSLTPKSNFIRLTFQKESFYNKSISGFFYQYLQLFCVLAVVLWTYENSVCCVNQKENLLRF